MGDPYWFQKKWGTYNEVPTDSLLKRIEELEEKYSALLLDVKRLEEENIETTNTLYEIMNTIDAVDTRIDIITAEKFLKDDV
jgi:septal ring factor EnvC (AmiA/AmiB activator)